MKSDHTHFKIMVTALAICVSVVIAALATSGPSTRTESDKPLSDEAKRELLERAAKVL